MTLDFLHNLGAPDQIEERLESIITALEKDLRWSGTTIKFYRYMAETDRYFTYNKVYQTVNGIMECNSGYKFNLSYSNYKTCFDGITTKFNMQS